MKKINWKSLIPLVFTIFAPQLALISSKAGVSIAPAMVGSFQVAMIFISLSDFLPIVQPLFLVIGGLLANGVSKGAADWKTNIIGFGTAVFGVLAGLGLNFAPTLKENILQLGALLVALFSTHPDTEGAEF